jgi:quercetin dioxygenase-like cupin family protein
MKKIAILTLLLLVSALAQARDSAPATVTSEVLAHATQSWDGAALPPYPAGDPEIRILRIRIPAGAELPVHKHPVINAGVLLAGKLTVITETGKELRLEAGQAIVEVVEQWHHGRNDGDETADIIVFYAGTAGVPITVMKPDAGAYAGEEPR